MFKKFESHVLENFSFLQQKKLLVAVSGGVDSVVLVHLLNKLGCLVSIAHCNFNLRKNESDLDQKFVESLGQKSSNQVFVKNFKTLQFAKNNKQSIQVAARNLRYNWFNELVTQHNFDYILTGHHADDAIETFLINLTRGTGLDGLLGIPAINGNIIRPLLVFSRNQVLDYANRNGIAWREDKSNASTKYSRNKIRHQIVPVLKEINPNLLESFSKTVQNLQESALIINDSIKNISKKVCISEGELIKIEIAKIVQLSNPKAYVYQLLKTYNFTEWNDVYNLIYAQSGKKVISKTHCLLKNRDYLLLSPIKLKPEQLPFYTINNPEQHITAPISLKISDVENPNLSNKTTIYIAKELLQFPLIIRKWQAGDYFYPKGMNGKKKLSKFFKDLKLSAIEKDKVWLLCNYNGDIVWVINKRQDNRYLKGDKKNYIITTNIT